MDAANKWRRFAVILSALAILALLAVAGSELLLQVAAGLSPRARDMLFPSRPVASVLPDPVLGYRANPALPGIDKNGFRNPAVLRRADIVAIGDSQTYGMGVASSQTWVRVLERRTSCRIYSMAFGGYGPLQYLILARRALALKPRLLIVGVYFGNDFFDNWEMYLRHPANYPVPETLKDPAVAREARRPLKEEVPDLFAAPPAVAQKKPAWSLHVFLSQQSALWGFARALKNRLFAPDTSFQAIAASLTPTQSAYASRFEGHGWKTMLTARYRHWAENDDDPRIRVGVWLTAWAVQAIDRLAQQHGVKLLVVLLPTKENVFLPKVAHPVEQPFLTTLTAEENRYRVALIRTMEGAKIAHLDLLPALRASVAQPYRENLDGHPNAVGSDVIAEALQKRVSACSH